MTAKVTLSATRGALSGQEFEFTERAACMVGRAMDCSIQLPGDAEHVSASRHHCLLDINPPDVRIRDFGSLNGTFVNGEKIGSRLPQQRPDVATRIGLREIDLKTGDEISIAGTTFSLAISVAQHCGRCGKELPLQEPEKSLCEACQSQEKAVQAAEAVTQYVPPAKQVSSKHCLQCGGDASQEIGDLRQGEYVCRACRDDLKHLILKNLAKAKTGKPELQAIKGYTIERELGRGGMGAVYLVRHEQTQQQMALKVMLPQVAADEHARQMFLREVDNTRALSHPNLVALHDYGSSDGAYFFTLEYCDGGDLAKLMKARGGVLAVDEAVGLLLQVLDGLTYAHQAPIPNVRLKDGSYRQGVGVVHRDLKPQNILLSRRETGLIAKVSDFGLAKAFDTAGLSGLTRTGTVGGTPYFMPREQVLDFRNAAAEVDVWSAAATLYFLLTGAFTRDFSADKERIWVDILEKNAVPIRQRKASLPPRLVDVIDAALQETPRIGFRSAAEFRAALAEAI